MEIENYLNRVDLTGISLVGNFQNKKYNLPTKIKKEFLSLPKIIIKEDDDVILCCIKSQKKYNFSVTFQFSDDDICIAKLYFLERFKNSNGDIQLVNTFIAKYTGFSKQNFKERAKTVFKLTNEEYDEISTLADKCLEEKQNLYRCAVNEMAKLDKNFVQDVIEVLKDCKIGKEILKILNQKLQECNYDVSSIGYWVNSKIILTQLLTKFQNDLGQTLFNKIDQLNQVYFLSFSDLKKKLKQKELERQKQYEDEALLYNINLNKKIQKQKQMQKQEEQTKKQQSISFIDDGLPYHLDKNQNGILDIYEQLFNPLHNLPEFSFWFGDMLGAFTLYKMAEMQFENTLQNEFNFFNSPLN